MSTKEPFPVELRLVEFAPKQDIVRESQCSDKDQTVAPSKGVELNAVCEKGIALDQELPIENDPVRKEHLQYAIRTFQSGLDIELSDMRLFLTRDECNALRVEMKELNPPVPPHIVSILQEYADLVEYADFLYRPVKRRQSPDPENSFEIGLHPKSPRHIRAENAYKRALGVLAETDREYPGIVDPWLDRPMYRDGDDFIHTHGPEGVPRLINSRSHNSQQRQKKRDLKLRALQNSLAKLDRLPSERHPMKSASVRPPRDEANETW